MATKRHIKHNLYLEFHANLDRFAQHNSASGGGDFTPNESNFFKWFMLLLLVGVLLTYWLGLKG